MDLPLEEILPPGLERPSCHGSGDELLDAASLDLYRGWSSRRRMQDDDQIAGDQTILVRLGDVVTVTALHDPPGRPAGTVLGRSSFSVGQSPTESGIDAIRRVDLAWYQYVRRDGTAESANPSVSEERISEDLAQASVFVSSAGTSPMRTFRATDLTNVVRFGLSEGTTLSRNDTLGVLVRPLSSDTLWIPLPAGFSAERIADRVAYTLNRLMGVEFAVAAQADADAQYVAISRGASGVNTLSFAIRDSGQVEVNRQGLERLEETFRGSQAATAAAIAVAYPDVTVLHTVVVPRIAVQQGDSLSATLAYQVTPRGAPPVMLVTSEAASGNDQSYPHVLAHEAAHALIQSPIPGVLGGNAECNGDPLQMVRHHPSPSNLLYCVTITRGERVGGPKRLAPVQQAQMRQDQANPATSLLKRP